MPAEIPAHTVLHVTNLHPTRAFTGQWENQSWKIAPGQTIIAPYYAACSWFGDPRAVNVGDPDAQQHTQFRTNERRRVSVLYGVYDHPWFRDAPYTALDPTDSRDIVQMKYEERDNLWWHPQLPYVEVKYIDGELATTVLADPEGDNLHTADPTTVQEAQVTTAAITDMQRQLAQLQSQLSLTNQRLEANPDFEGDVGGRIDDAVIGPNVPASADDGNLPARPQRPTRPVRT